MDLIKQFLENIPYIIQIVADLLFAIMLLATIVVRLFPGAKKVGESVGKVKGWLLWAIERAPTLGLNPRTKALKDALIDLESRE